MRRAAPPRRAGRSVGPRRAREPNRTVRAEPCADPTRVVSGRARDPARTQNDSEVAHVNAPYDVNGRTVFITGAARGIGAATAERLHAKGANVALVGLEPERLEENAARLGDRAACFEADVTDFDALQRAVAGTVERFGGIDVAIANAGLAFVGALATAPIEQVERTFAVNLLGVWRTDRAVIGHIVARRGYLLNICSLSAVAHTPLMGPYTSTKAGVEALT